MNAARNAGLLALVSMHIASLAYAITPTPTPTQTYCSAGQNESIFTVAVSADDCMVRRYDYSSYPPSRYNDHDCLYHTIIPQRGWTGSYYAVVNGLLRWDTSRQPDGNAWPPNTMAVTAFFRGRHAAQDQAFDRTSLVFEWYPWTPPAGDAYWTVGYPLPADPTFAGTDPISNSPGWHTTALSHVDQINLFGYTGMRINVSGGQPSGDNWAQIYTIDYDLGQLTEQLVVCWTTATPATGGSATPTPSRTASGTLTPTSIPTRTPTSTAVPPSPASSNTPTRSSTATPATTLSGTPTGTPTPTLTPGQSQCPAGSTTSTFSVAASVDDGQARHYDYGPAYPPMASNDQSSTLSYVTVERKFTGSYYATTVALMRWNTATQPSGTPWPTNASVTGAFFRARFSATGNQTVDNDPLVLEWYAWTPPVSDAHWTNNAPSPTDATYAGTDRIANWAAYRSVPLTNLARINLSGYTGMRASIGGGQPTGFNGSQWYTWDYSGGALPEQLVICWR